MRDANLAENVPRSKLSNAGWTALAINASGTQAPPTSARFDIEYGNTLMFGAPETSPDYETWKEVIIPEEAWNIDTKLDDGQPGTGSVIAMFWDNRCANAANNTDTSSQYRLTDTAVQCALVFRNAF